MKRIHKINSIIAILCLFSSVLYGQSSSVSQDETLAIITTEEEKTATKTAETPKAIPEYYRHHQELSGIYSGYAIELTRAKIALPRDYYLFDRFGSVFIERTEDGTIAYLILLKEFTSDEAALRYLNQVILPQAEEAQVIKYKIGKRI